MTPALTWDLEFYNGAAWVSIKNDTRGEQATGQHGFTGNQPTDRVAGAGSLQFTLNNAVDNSGAVEGYYSPGGTHCRTGFELGAKFRLKISDGTTTVYQVLSKATTITPVPGIHGSRETAVVCADYMNDLNNAPLQQIPIQANKRIDEALTTILTYPPVAPLHTSFAMGPETYPRLLFGMSDNKAALSTALQRLMQTDKSYCFLIGDAIDGETMVWQSRHTRTTYTSAATFADTMQGISIERDNKNIFNEITTVAHPCAVDAVGAEVILGKTDALEFSIPPGGSITTTIPFTDPLQLGRRVDMIYGSQPAGWPVTITDYKASATAGSGGSDKNAKLTITPGLGANSAAMIFGNTDAALIYVSLFHIRGRGIYDYTPVEKVNSDTLANRQIHGTIPLRYDMPFQDKESVANAFGAVILNDSKAPHNYVKEITFLAYGAVNAALAATLDVGKVLTVSETITGLSGDYWIQSMKWECMANNIIQITAGNFEPAMGFDWTFRLCDPAADVTLPTTSLLAPENEIPVPKTLTLQSAEASAVDTIIITTPDNNTNYGTNVLLAIGKYNGYGNRVYRTLPQWDLSSIPAIATVVSASFALHIQGSVAANAHTARIFRMIHAWTEAGSTWEKYNGASAWPGGAGGNGVVDCEAADIGSLAFGTSDTGWKTFALTPAKVQEWIAGTLTNNGVMIKMDTENDDFYYFESSSDAAAALRPIFIVIYTLPFQPNDPYGNPYHRLYY